MSVEGFSLVCAFLQHEAVDLEKVVSRFIYSTYDQDNRSPSELKSVGLVYNNVFP